MPRDSRYNAVSRELAKLKRRNTAYIAEGVEAAMGATTAGLDLVTATDVESQQTFLNLFAHSMTVSSRLP